MTHLIRVLVFGLCLLATDAHAAGDTPLLEAVESRDKAKIEALLAKGAEVNAKDEDGSTPLHWAAASGNKDLVELLLAKGAEVNAKDEDGSTPLHRAATSGNKDLVELLLAKGANISAKEPNNGWTPLHMSVSYGNKDVAELLLAKGADVNAKAKDADPSIYISDGCTPLHLATDMGPGSKAIAELLLAYGADINARERHGYTPFHMAISKGEKDTAEWLLANGADINTKDGFERTPLHFAVEDGRKDIAEWLLAHSADINAKGLSGNTPLHVVVEHRNWDLVRWLVAHGADANARNMSRSIRPLQDGRLPINGGGETPADVAESRIGDPENRRVMVTFLEKAAIASWQQSGGSSPHQALQKLAKQLKGESRNQTLRKAILDLAPKLQPQPAVPPEADHFEGRAKYIFKDAKSNTDMLDAAREYLKALEVAPWIADYYFNLCLILEQANRPFEAQRACEFYLVAAPEAEDGSAVRMRIAGFEVQMERKQYKNEVRGIRGIREDEGLDWLATYNLYR